MSEGLIDGFDVAAERLPGHGQPWLDDLRRGALEHFKSTGLPTPQDEDWRFTNLAPLGEFSFRPEVSTSTGSSESTLQSSTGSPIRLVFQDGRFDAGSSSAGPVPEGVRIGSLAHALAERPQDLRAHLGTVADAKGRPLWGLNTAWFEDGALIEVPDHATLEAPIQVDYQQTGQGTRLVSPRCLIVMGHGSRATVVERYAALGPGPYLVNALTEAVLEPEARLTALRIQEESDTGFHLAGFASRQERDSHLQQISIALGARLSRVEISALLAGEGADCALDGLYLAKQQQHVDHHTTIDHAVAHCTSRELYKGILDGHAHAVFHGRVHVRPHAQKTSAAQTNRNLVISNDAQINTKPQLEILADDVRCTHGATIGRIEQEALFYLRSRGIALAEARAILTDAFASEIADRLPGKELRSWLRSWIRQWLGATAR